MSTKPNAKSVKRASSTSKKKGVGGTPDSSSTPTSSGASIGIEKPGQESTIDDILAGDEVEALRIRDEDLIKVHPPKPPSMAKPIQPKRKVIVRKNQPLTGAGPSHHREMEVAVLHPLPLEAAITATRTLGSVEEGPRFDQRGMFLSHSVLGPVEDYSQELKMRKIVGSTSPFVKPPPVVLPNIRKQPQVKDMSYEKTILPREEHSLKCWDESMKQRRNQQHHLSEKVGSVPEKLIMNQGDAFRSVQEERMIIDRTMPSVNYGKGYRVGSEFWSQHVPVGSQDTGIHTTLTRTERGLPPELEFVGIPTLVAKERGINKDLERNAPSHYTWDKSLYLSTRREQLVGPLTDLHRPEVSQLVVVGKAPKDSVLQRTDSLDSIGESGSSIVDEESESVLDVHEDVTFQPIIGPALLVNGQLLRWEGPPLPIIKDKPHPKLSRGTQSESALGALKSQQSTASLREVDGKRVKFHSSPVNFKINFESEVGAMVSSHVELENCGTAAVYYSWQSLPEPNPLGTIQAGDVQRFYFDTRGGVLLPGQTLTFPFVFKSSNAGIFSERWLFQTGPVLCRGRQVVFSLKGVAFQEDYYKQKRDNLEREMKHRMAVSAAERLVNQLIDSIRTPPHTPDPIPMIETEDYVFRVRNPSFYYHHGVVQQLKSLYDSILRPELVAAEQLAQDSSIKSDKSGTSAKKEDKPGIGKAKEKASGKEKKGNKLKDDTIIIKEPTISSPGDHEEPQVPDWDLTISGLQEIILNLNEPSVVESKLKELSHLVGYLSFPPPKQIKRKNYKIVYETLCEAVDLVYDVSASLCLVMGLPLREFSQKEESASGNKQADIDGATSSQPASPAHTKEKKGKDSKKIKSGKESTKTGGSKSKTLSQKKSKLSCGSTLDMTKQAPSEITTEVVDPVTKKNYSDSFYSLVYEILGTATSRIDFLLTQN